MFPTNMASAPRSAKGMQAIVFFTGQVVINNVDILLVKHFFNNDQAGLYAAIALVGRVLYLASWSVVSAMFPVSAGVSEESDNSTVLVVPLAIVLFISVAFIIGLGAFPEPVLRATFGSSFQMSPDMHSLLGLRAAATGTYCLAVVLMAYGMSRQKSPTPAGCNWRLAAPSLSVLAFTIPPCATSSLFNLFLWLLCS